MSLGVGVMSSSFSKEEKKKFLFQKHLKDHLLEYIFDFVGPILLTALMLYLCKAEKFWIGIFFSVAYSSGKTIYNIYHYKKEYIDIDVK